MRISTYNEQWNHEVHKLRRIKDNEVTAEDKERAKGARDNKVEHGSLVARGDKKANFYCYAFKQVSQDKLDAVKAFDCTYGICLLRRIKPFLARDEVPKRHNRRCHNLYHHIGAIAKDGGACPHNYLVDTKANG